MSVVAVFAARVLLEARFRLAFSEAALLVEPALLLEEFVVPLAATAPPDAVGLFAALPTPPELLPPGATRRQKFDSVGGFAIRDAEYPHLMISVIVVDSPYFATVDEKGSFSIAGVPDGKANLKVWTRGKWASEQEIEAGSKEELIVKVTSARDKEKEAAEPSSD